MTYLARVALAIETFGRSIDVLCNELFWPVDGLPDQTISNHAALDRAAGGRVGCWLCAALAVLVQPRHCDEALNDDAMPWWAYLRAAACLGVTFFAAGYALSRLI